MVGSSLVGDVTGNGDANLLRNTYRQLNRKRTSDHMDRARRRFKEEADDGA